MQKHCNSRLFRKPSDDRRSRLGIFEVKAEVGPYARMRGSHCSHMVALKKVLTLLPMLQEGPSERQFSQAAKKV